MSTRCQIQVKNANGSIYPCRIYKHMDGGKETVLPFLKDFTKRFCEARGVDPEYFVAQYLRHIAFAEQKRQDGMDFYRENPDYKVQNSFLGYGVTTEIHGDIQYLYTVDLKTGKIQTQTL